MTTSNCKAKDPNTCPYHGAIIRMEEALRTNNTTAYLEAYGEVQQAAATRNLKNFLKGEERRPKISKASERELELMRMRQWREKVSQDPEMKAALEEAEASVAADKALPPHIQEARRRSLLRWYEGYKENENLK